MDIGESTAPREDELVAKNLSTTKPRVRWERPVAVLLTSLTAVMAYAGAIGLVGGGTDFGPTVNARLPWHSPVLAGIGLALLVGLPMTAAAWRMFQDYDSAIATVSILAGGWLIGWIGVQLVVIRTPNPMQAVCVGVGAVLIGLGIRVHHQGDPHRPHATRATRRVADAKGRQ